VSVLARRGGAKPSWIAPIYLAKPRGEKIDKRPHLCRQMAAMRIIGINRKFERQEFCQNRNKLA
jgi:hypothetical protein